MTRHTLLLAAAAVTLLTVAQGAPANRSPDPELLALLSDAVNETTSFPDKFEAEVWLKDMAMRLGDQVNDHDEKVLILTQVHWEAKRANLPPEMILAVIDIESAFDPYAVSSAGAQGLMQVMPFWLDEIGLPGDRLVDIRTNLRMGVTILKYYYDMERGDWVRALGRYNGSLGSRVYPEKVLNRLSNRWFQG